MADHRIYAAVYDRMCAPAERAGLADRRRTLLAAATGRCLEVGAGTGHNLPYYPPAITEVVLLEPDGAMRRRLQPRLAEAPAPARLVAAGIDDADLQDRSFDTIVCTLVLCTVPDLDAALARVRALLAPGGRLLFLEHVLGAGARARLQHAVTPVWRRLVPGCHADRNITGAIRRSGLLVRDSERIRLPLCPGILDVGVIGVASEPRARPSQPVRGEPSQPTEGRHPQPTEEGM